MNGSLHQNRENRNLYYGLPPLRASPRHGYQGVFLEFLVSNLPGGAPSEVAAFIVPALYISYQSKRDSAEPVKNLWIVHLF